MQKHRKQVREIPANPFLQNQNRGKRLRVAAYCRVSTEQEEQESSFENQVEYYTNLIQSNPDWECAGIFADRGISGTKDTIRPEFMKMIEECKKHKIDLILTKSLSRFSRNTLDSITYIRLLKSLNVAVEFEKEGLNTSDVSSEIYLTWQRLCPGGKRIHQPECDDGNAAAIQGRKVCLPLQLLPGLSQGRRWGAGN